MPVESAAKRRMADMPMMPQAHLAIKIEDMDVGEPYYAFPEAIRVDESGKAWVVRESTVYPQQTFLQFNGLTAAMCTAPLRIYKMGGHEYTIRILPGFTLTWTPSEMPPGTLWPVYEMTDSE